MFPNQDICVVASQQQLGIAMAQSDIKWKLSPAARRPLSAGRLQLL